MIECRKLTAQVIDALSSTNRHDRHRPYHQTLNNNNNSIWNRYTVAWSISLIFSSFDGTTIITFVERVERNSNNNKKTPLTEIVDDKYTDKMNGEFPVHINTSKFTHARLSFVSVPCSLNSIYSLLCVYKFSLHTSSLVENLNGQRIQAKQKIPSESRHKKTFHGI